MTASPTSSAKTSAEQSGITSRCSSSDGLPVLQEGANVATTSRQAPIAVIGMGCRLPGHSTSPTALWDFLQKGGVARNEPPSSRFSLAGHYDGSGRPRTMKSPGGMFMEDVDPAVFDGQFFNVSQSDCVAMDPQQRQLLEVTYECLENAGVRLDTVSGSMTGVIVGFNFTDYSIIQSRDPEDRMESATVGISSAILSNRISHFLNVHGPSMSVDTACSASLIAVDMACRYLDSHQADGMLVGGANMWLNPDYNEEVGMMNKTQSGSGRCHSFDAKADGYVKAEGINVVYLKRLEDAVRDGDPIRAVIRGTASRASGRTAGIANPSAEAQALTIREAYSNAGITDFQATSFLECHGTGTLAGDPIEVQGAASVFAEGRESQEALVIGSIKSNIGHSEAAAGLSGLIKAVMAVERGIIPGTPTFITPNPKIDWEASRVRASRTSLKWPTSRGIRRASVNSFGFGGANAHAVIEQGPDSGYISSYRQGTLGLFDNDDEAGDATLASETTRTEPTLLVFSANDQKALKGYLKTLSAHLDNPRVSVTLRDLSYTLSERRTRHYYRAYMLNDSSEIKIYDDALVHGKQAPHAPRLGFVFTGQGAQWPQMGRDLLAAFPLARSVIQRLDDALQTLPDPPSWSLLAELTEERSPEALRQPEFSQPLVTALQLALVEVLSSWGIAPRAVVGHSSGEIAAAAAAGLITERDAIVVAYYRGQAAKKVGPASEAVGMLAVGVAPDVVERYLGPEDKIQIACYNGPKSLTMSGTISALQALRDRLQQDGHFARLLQVNLAYHSRFMAEIGTVYEEMLLGDNERQPKNKDVKPSGVRMFSSVTAAPLLATESPDAAYWKSNLLSPVQFTQATSALLKDTEHGADFLVEIGPSNALSGPIAQIKESLSVGAPYTSALKRGSESTRSLYDLAGQLFLHGGAVDVSSVNRQGPLHSATAPKTIVDLPNYSWNHSNSYWHESQASRDWRFKKFILHDLLGSKTNGSPWESPAFKKVLRLSDLPWLLDHRMIGQVVFPGAGYVAMAVEAIRQTSLATQWKGEEPARFRYRLRDVKLLRGLVLEETQDTRVTLELHPVQGGSTRSWFEFTVRSLQDSIFTEHCTGFVCVETDYQDVKAPEGAIKPLDLPLPASVWYKALAGLGYGFGPSFKKHLMTEGNIGARKSRSTVNLEPPAMTTSVQSAYTLHPAVIDSVFQAASPSQWQNDPFSVDTVLIPRVIDGLVIRGGKAMPAEGIVTASSAFLGAGNPDMARNYANSAKLYDPQDGDLLFELKGLGFAPIEKSEQEGPGHTFARLSWNADIGMLMEAGPQAVQQWASSSGGEAKTAQDLIDLVAHKKPGLKVLELNLGEEDDSSIWIRENHSGNPMRAYAEHHLAIRGSEAAFASAQEQLASQSSGTQFHLLNSAVQATTAFADIKSDLAIVKGSGVAKEDEKLYLEIVAKSLDESGFILALGVEEATLQPFGKTIQLPLLGQEEIFLCQIASGRAKADGESKSCPPIIHASLLDAATQKEFAAAQSVLLADMAKREWSMETCSNPSEDITSGEAVVVVFDELFANVMGHLDEGQWGVLKHIISQQRCSLLWVTTGGHLDITDPNKGAAAGLLRTIRSEESLKLMTLDVESPTGDSTADAISFCLGKLAEYSGDDGAEAVPLDWEFVERGGLVHVSRVVPDQELTALQSDEVSARKTETVDIHDIQTTVQLGCERLGNIDSLHFGETAPEPIPLEDGWLEVEPRAAGLNYKDVLISMGLVPGDETALGFEGAGVVTKVTPGVDFKVGERVAFLGKGCFANRVQTTPGRVHCIPDAMTFDEAATLCVVYLTSLYSLYDLAELTAGKSVLIHSAAGGVGIAAVQLAQHVGADVYVTVGTEEKREFIRSTFSIDDNHIFNSRNTDFADQILEATDGRGVDAVLNSLTGDMLQESFRILANGGTMVEIGKKDILDRNGLAMAPFDRNISFRAVDLSPGRASEELVGGLMTRLFKLINAGAVKPINPIHRFSWTDISTAIRFLRAGKHIGKIVLSNEGNEMIQAPIRRAPKSLGLRPDRCYLIVGGLRGLCGALAIYLAMSGAKNLAVISRSGYADEKSRAVVKQINAIGAHIDLLTADVTVEADVERAFKETAAPVAGIIQGAMVLRDRPFDSMSLQDYHDAIKCKIQGTWALHNTALKLGIDLEFFTLLSSISGLVGNRGQANYAAANVFQDSFATFRRQRGQAACSINLGVISDDGVMAENPNIADKHFDQRTFFSIDTVLLRKILYVSILQQQDRPAAAAVAPQAQIVTGVVYPQTAQSQLRGDARFAALFTGQGAEAGGEAKSGDAEVQALLGLLGSPTVDAATKQSCTVDLVNKALMRIMRLSEPMDPARPFAVYGIDSLSAVEIRNWVRTELGALVTTLDIMNATSLASFCEKIVAKIVGAEDKADGDK